MDRRDFLKKMSAATAGAVVAGGLELNASERRRRGSSDKPGAGSGLELPEGSIILFTGDSITDGARERKYYRLYNHIRALGNGYVQLTATRLNYMFPDRDLKIYNTGINGDTIEKMMARLETDCIKLKPDFVSVLIGVNDFNVSFSRTGKGNPDKYEREYRQMLGRIKSALPDVRFIIGEPYAVKGAREITDAWYPEFEAYPAIARKMAEEFGAAFIPYQSVYAEAAAGAPERYFSTDGVHPSIAGVRLMSNAWLSYVNPR